MTGIPWVNGIFVGEDHLDSRAIYVLRRRLRI